MTGLLAVEAAQAALLALADPLPTQARALVDAAGCYLADPLVAKRSQPVTALSAMDGYAIRHADLPGPWRLAGEVRAGSWPEAALEQGCAVRIFTGAALPAGADTILVQEDGRVADGIVTLTGDGPPAIASHVRAASSDFAQGALLLQAGARLTPAALALAAMAGFGTVTVGGKPRVAIITTGDEVVAPGAALAPGQIPDSNSVMLAAMLDSDAVCTGSIVHVPDNRASTATAISKAAEAHDVIVTVGGASVGTHDHVHGALTELGAPPRFWKVAMRPGKPVMAARLGGAVVLGLPGNPASAFVTAQLFLRPLLRHLAGAARPLPDINFSPLAVPLAQGGARRDYLRAVHDSRTLTPCASQDSGSVVSLAAANALILREIGATALPSGVLVPYIAV